VQHLVRLREHGRELRRRRLLQQRLHGRLPGLQPVGFDRHLHVGDDGHRGSAVSRGRGEHVRQHGRVRGRWRLRQEGEHHDLQRRHVHGFIHGAGGHLQRDGHLPHPDAGLVWGGLVFGQRHVVHADDGGHLQRRRLCGGKHHLVRPLQLQQHDHVVQDRLHRRHRLRERQGLRHDGRHLHADAGRAGLHHERAVQGRELYRRVLLQRRLRQHLPGVQHGADRPGQRHVRQHHGERRGHALHPGAALRKRRDVQRHGERPHRLQGHRGRGDVDLPGRDVFERHADPAEQLQRNGRLHHPDRRGVSDEPVLRQHDGLQLVVHRPRGGLRYGLHDLQRRRFLLAVTPRPAAVPPALAR